jgi:hypothetical protein
MQKHLISLPFRFGTSAMSDPKDKKSDPKPPPAVPEAEKGSGRVAFDARGNPVWEWEASTGIFSRDVSTQRLKMLEAKDLAIVETPPTETKKKSGAPELSLEEPGRASRALGFNPYDSSSAVNPRSKVADEPRKKPSDLRKLDQWIKLKKGLDKDKK